MSALVATELSIGYSGHRPLIEQVSLEAHPGEFICVLGRNGIGKSTLLRTLAGLHAPLAGEVRLGEQVVASMSPEQRAQQVAVVLTDRIPMPGLTARDVVELGRLPFTSWLGVLSTADHQMVEESLRVVQATALAARTVDDLSDGERQRVMIARALAQRPTMLLLDEITAFLDLPSRVAMMTLLRGLARSRGCLVILSTHDLELSLQLADRLWLLPGDGLLIDNVPEAIALDGHVSRAFDQQHVHFAMERGTFTLTPAEGPPVQVAGEQPARFWTAQALKRSGWTVDEASDRVSVVVDVGRDGDGYRWVTSNGEEHQTCRSLAELLSVLRRT
ncbi:MAG: ABC transporter ATP-binding protein [Gemmatimonadaceae bacterium]|jgi:iron complex transport system ATP-binding protein|nr:ABC transporter ATP-binding protein [Gemmatimonadaceae bacterium]